MEAIATALCVEAIDWVAVNVIRIRRRGVGRSLPVAGILAAASGGSSSISTVAMVPCVATTWAELLAIAMACTSGVGVGARWT